MMSARSAHRRRRRGFYNLLAGAAPVVPFNGNFTSVFTPANTLFSLQSDLGLTYGVTPKATVGNTSTSIITLSGALAADAMPVPVMAKATNSAVVGAGASFDIYYDGGTTAAMVGVVPAAATPVALTGLGAGLFLAWAAGTGVTNDSWKACCAALADQSGNGKHAVQAVVTKQPVIIPGPGGAGFPPALLFDGVDDFLQITITLPAPGTTPFWGYSLWKEDAWTLNAPLFGSPGVEFTMRVLQYNTTPSVAMNQSIQTNSATIGNPAIATYARLITGWTNSAADTLRFGGTPDINAGAPVAGNSANTNLQIGAGFGGFFAGTFVGFVGLNAKPSAAQFAAADAISWQKYAGLLAVSRLPAGTSSGTYPLSGFNTATTSWFADTVTMGLTGAVPNQNYQRDHYARCRVQLPGTSTALTVEAVSSGLGANDTVGVWTTTDSSGTSGWTYNQTVTFTSYGLKQQVAIVLPVGTRCVDITDGAFVTGISAPSYAIASVTDKSNICIVHGDSIADGSAAVPKFIGFTQQFRYSGKFDAVFLDTLSGTSIRSDSVAGTTVAAAAAALVARAQSYGTAATKTILCQKITNDYGSGDPAWTAALFQTWLGNLIDAVHALDASIQWVQMRGFHRQTETANSAGNTLDDYGNAAATVISARSSYCRLIDGRTAWTQGEITAAGDGLHPNNALMTQAYNWLLTQF